MKKNWILVLMACCFSMQLLAQQNDGELLITKSDPQATKILKKIGKKYEEYDGIIMEYTLEMEGGDDVEKQSGKLYQKGKKYKVKHDGNEIYCDGQTVWFYIESERTVQINDFDPDEEEGNFLSPAQLMNLEGMQENFIYGITNNNSAEYAIEFKPVDRDEVDFFKARLVIDKDNSSIKHLKVFYEDGSRHTLYIDKLKEASLGEGNFKFDRYKYPGLKIEDLRE